VNTFISNHQSIPFNADWILVAKWIDVCPFGDRTCTDHEVYIIKTKKGYFFTFYSQTLFKF
jgi:hypothetical protein